MPLVRQGRSDRAPPVGSPRFECQSKNIHDKITTKVNVGAIRRLPQKENAYNSRKAEIDYERCVGCGQCVALCQYDGAVMGEGDTSERLNYKIDEYTKAVLADKPHFHVSFIMNVSPECDCWNHNDAAIIPDLGIAASFDPVALDKACADMVINAPIIGGNKLAETHPHEHLEGEDKFHLIHPDTNWQAGLRYAEEIGLGSQAYELITV